MTDRGREEAEQEFKKWHNNHQPGCFFFQHEKDAWLAAWHRSRAAAIEECAKIAEATPCLRQDGRPSLTVNYDIAASIRTLSQQEDGK